MGIYYCDGSQRADKIGAGICCLINREQYSHHFTTSKDHANSEDAEAFSILKTLEVAVSFHDRDIIIYNDSRHFLKKIQLKKNQQACLVVNEKIEQLMMQGFRIKLLPVNKYKSNQEQQYIDIAHKLSQSYMKL